MEIDHYDHGVPSWVDIGTTDLAAAVAFYSSLFGWECEEGPPETGGYTIASLRGRRIAGMGPQQNPEAPTACTTYINVDDADDVQTAVETNGGTTLFGPLDVMDQGRMAIFTDPTGGVIGVWQAGTNTGAQLVNEPGALAWNEVITTDPAVTDAFYTAVFGWGTETTEGERAYTQWLLGDRSVGGSLPKPPLMPAETPTHWGVYFAVEDLDLSVGRIGDLGGQIVLGPMGSPAGPFATAVDPTGGIFSIIQLGA